MVNTAGSKKVQNPSIFIHSQISALVGLIYKAFFFFGLAHGAMFFVFKIQVYIPFLASKKYLHVLIGADSHMRGM